MMAYSRFVEVPAQEAAGMGTVIAAVVWVQEEV
jgi:hypothetical protein